jgi:hypothetical protein
MKAEASNLDSYRSLLRAQTGKAITAENSQTLTTLSYGL